MKKILILLCAWGMAAPVRADVILSLINPLTNTEFVSVAPGGTFSLIYRVSGLTTPALDNFDTELDTLPSGVTLTSFTSMLPAGWFFHDQPSLLKFSGAGDSGLTGNYDLVAANFSVAPDAAPGNFAIEFVPANPISMELRDAAFEDIPYVPESASLTIAPVPEPSAVFFLFGGLAVVLLLRARFGAALPARVKISRSRRPSRPAIR